jgi:hypothetical protein
MEEPEQAEPDVPHDDELDVEGPNESAPGHHTEADSSDDEDSDA